ncbi:AMIN domain-containing protein [Thermodesulfobium sp. 4217-1]|uniref:AMIN domain-containing protein n=1 Tax=Thermodesulfobium sp. 4217-1 TaxID=3120013 RepID=UPI00322168AA
MKFFLAFIFLFLLTTVGIAYADTLPKVQNVSYKTTENGVEVFVNVQGNPNFNYFRMADGRIVLDIDKSIISKKGDISTISPMVTGIHFAQNTPDKVRVVIESDKNYPYIVSRVAGGLEVNVGSFKVSDYSSNRIQSSSPITRIQNNSLNTQNIRTGFNDTQSDIVGNSDVNNPGNLRSVYGGFNSYRDINCGIYAAYYNIIRKPGYYNGGNESIRNIIFTWAPPRENNSSRYLNDVIMYCNRSGLNINEDTNFSSLSLEQQEIVLSAIFNEEGNRDWLNATKTLSSQQRIALINDSILQHSTSNYIASNSTESVHPVVNPTSNSTSETRKAKQSSPGVGGILGKAIGILGSIL